MTADEFEGAWSVLIDEFLQANVAKCGLSRAEIFVTVAAFVSIIALVLAFVLVTLSAWKGESSFESIVQSLLVGGISRGAFSLPYKRVKGLDAKTVDAIVDKLLGEQRDNATDD